MKLNQISDFDFLINSQKGASVWVEESRQSRGLPSTSHPHPPPHPHHQTSSSKLSVSSSNVSNASTDLFEEDSPDVIPVQVSSQSKPMNPIMMMFRKYVIRCRTDGMGSGASDCSGAPSKPVRSNGMLQLQSMSGAQWVE